MLEKSNKSSTSSSLSSVIDISNGRSNSTAKYQEFGSKLSFRIKLFYSFGHVYNDLCGSIWFSYTLLFFKLSFDDTTAGMLLLWGQLSDAISTVLIGYISDKDLHLFFFRYGRRKIWHLIGSIIVTCSFPLIFNSCVLCSHISHVEMLIFYGIFIALFQFGWAAVQVAHLALITDLTDSSSERVELNSYRQAASVASSVCVYGITLMLLGVDDSTISQSDSIVFMKVVYLITIIGIVFSALFHSNVKEPVHKEIVELKDISNSRGDGDVEVFQSNDTKFSYSSNLKLNFSNNEKPKPNLLEQNLQCADTVQTPNSPNIEEKYQTEIFEKPTSQSNNDQLIWSDWLKSTSFWKICLIYTMSRLYVNLTQVYTPLYLQETLHLAKRNIAIVPFITYLTGFIFSLVSKSKYINSKNIVSIGCVFSLISCLWILISNLSITIYEVYAVASAFGIGGTFMLIGSLSLTADLISKNKISGAFVYGMMSFFDKLINGMVIALVQHFKPNQQLEPISSLVNSLDTSSYSNATVPVSIGNLTSVVNSIATTTVTTTINTFSRTRSIENSTVFYLDVLVYISGAAVVITFLSLTLVMGKEIQKMFRFVQKLFSFH